MIIDVRIFWLSIFCWDKIGRIENYWGKFPSHYFSNVCRSRTYFIAVHSTYIRFAVSLIVRTVLFLWCSQRTCMHDVLTLLRLKLHLFVFSKIFTLVIWFALFSFHYDFFLCSDHPIKDIFNKNKSLYICFSISSSWVKMD